MRVRRARLGSRRKKLIAVARLYLLDRPKYGRSCSDCRKYQYDPDSGQVKEDKAGRPLLMPRLRGREIDPPCHACPKTIGLRVRHWRGAADPPPWAYQTFRHFLECRAVGWQVPDAADPIVRRNAKIVEGVEASIAAGRADGIEAMLAGLMTRGRRG